MSRRRPYIACDPLLFGRLSVDLCQQLVQPLLARDLRRTLCFCLVIKSSGGGLHTNAKVRKSNAREAQGSFTFSFALAPLQCVGLDILTLWAATDQRSLAGNSTVLLPGPLFSLLQPLL